MLVWGDLEDCHLATRRTMTVVGRSRRAPSPSAGDDDRLPEFSEKEVAIIKHYRERYREATANASSDAIPVSLVKHPVARSFL